MSEEKPRIIVKRVVKRVGGHHGGTWKIAFADFMTAMMALFLVLWLLATVTPKQRAGIAEHFRTPLKVVLSGGEKSSASSSVIPGGGADQTQVDFIHMLLTFPFSHQFGVVVYNITSTLLILTI